MSIFRASRALGTASSRAVASLASRDGVLSAVLGAPNAGLECLNATDAAFASTLEGRMIGSSTLSASWPRAQRVLTPAQSRQQDDLRLASSLWAGNQGENYQGDKPAENPRNDVPPVGPEGRPGNVPPSPDKTNAEVNNMDYSAPGTQTDSSKSRNPTGGTSDGNKPGSGGQKLTPREGADVDPVAAPWSALPQDAQAHLRARNETSSAQADGRDERVWVHLVPVESMLEGDSGVTSAISAKEGPTNTEDNPAGHDRPDPQVVPEEETPEDTEAIEKEKEKIKQRKAETGAPNQGIQSGDSERAKSPATQI